VHVHFRSTKASQASVPTEENLGIPQGQIPFLESLNEQNAQLARQPDAKLRRALRASPQFGAGCG